MERPDFVNVPKSFELRLVAFEAVTDELEAPSEDEGANTSLPRLMHRDPYGSANTRPELKAPRASIAA